MRHKPLLSGPEPITRIVLNGTFIVVGLMTTLLLISVLIGNIYVLPRLLAGVATLSYVGISAWFFTKGRYTVSAWMLVIFYVALGTLVLAVWGVNTPIGLLILGFSIVLAGIMLGARYIIWTTFVITILLLCMQALLDQGALHPDASQLGHRSTYLDVVSHAVVFLLFAVIAWLAGRRNEQLLHKSQRAESALQKEKALLSVRLERKTREVREAQLEEMRQLYQFAELGQLGAVLLHDLANNLTALTLDIDDIGRRMQRNESITRAKESIAYVETMVNGVRRQIHERDKPVVFDALRAIFETVASLGAKARRSNITIEYAPHSHAVFFVKGDPIRFAHILTILVSNAVDAYKDTDDPAPRIVVSTKSNHGRLQILVTDHGKGISEPDRERLFKPFSSTKADGMGIGLFMAREMTEQHFNGTLIFDESLADTTFVMELPRARGRAKARQ